MGGHLTALLARIEQPDLCGLCPKAINRVTERSKRLSTIARDVIDLLDAESAAAVVSALADAIYG